MLSRNLEQTLHRALGLASERRHEYATLEHLLLSLAEDSDAAGVLKACAVDVEKLRRELTEFLDKDLAGLVTDRAGDPKPTAGFQRVVQRAAIHVQSSGRDEVTGANVLVALFSERESHAVYFLQQQDMSRLDAVNYISHGIAKVPGRAEKRPVQGNPQGGEEGGDQPGETCPDDREIHPAVGRERGSGVGGSVIPPQWSVHFPSPARQMEGRVRFRSGCTSAVMSVSSLSARALRRSVSTGRFRPGPRQVMMVT